MAPCLQGQYRPSAQVRVPWRFDAPDSTAMLTPRHSSSLAASTQLRCLHDDFDAALGTRHSSTHWHPADSAEVEAPSAAPCGTTTVRAVYSVSAAEFLRALGS